MVSRCFKIFEPILIVLLFLFFSGLLIGGVRDRQDLIWSLVLVSGAGGLTFLKKQTRSFSLWAVFTALMVGFWLFNLMRLFGLIQWPLQIAYDLKPYLKLFYSHLVLAIIVLVPVFITKELLKPSVKVKIGRLNRPFANFGSFLTWAGAIGVMGWAVWFVFRDFNQQEAFWLFLLIAIAKAFLTGFTEEFCYRGVIQKAGLRVYGVAGAIVLQAVLYAAFHLNLNPVFFPKVYFLLIVFAIGILFGWMTYLTKGIGWVVLVHTAIDLVVEWNNIL